MLNLKADIWFDGKSYKRRNSSGKKLRAIYGYMAIEQKQETLKLLMQDREELNKEFKKAADSYPKIIRQVISDTLDKWALEIEELTLDINNEKCNG